MQTTIFILLIVIAYLLGSVNSGIIIAKYFYKVDIRDFGSQNAGATNTLRTLGPKAAATVFILDILKPIIIILVARLFFKDTFSSIVGKDIWLGLATIIGQCFPVFFGFKGGKGAASTLGTIIIGYPLTLAFAAAVFLLILFIWKYVSLATMVAIISNGVLAWFIYPDLIIPYICIALLVIWMHRANITRLLQGTENKISFNKK